MQTPSTLGFFHAMIATWVDIFRDKSVFLVLLIAPIFYGVFYAWPYSTQTARQLPVAIVDLDHSELSATIIRYAQASPMLKMTQLADEKSAQEAMWRQHISGYLLIPQGLSRQVMQNREAHVVIETNGGYLLLNKEIMRGFSEVVGTVAAGISIKRAIATGQHPREAYENHEAVSLISVPMFNSNEGYGSYIVPAVTFLILHQTLLIGATMLISARNETRREILSFRAWLGRIAAFSVIGCLMTLYYFGWVFYLHDYPRAGNLAGALLLAILFPPAVAALGCIIGITLKRHERAMQLLIALSLPLFLISGYIWPADLLPYPLQLIRWVVPSTAAVQAGIHFNQMGATLAESARYLVILMAQTAVYLIILKTLITHDQNQRP